MKDNELETLLRTLAPAAPSPELARRVERDMELTAMFRHAAPTEASSRRPLHAWLNRVTWTALGAAAAVTVMSALQRPEKSSVVASIATPTLNAPVVTSSREWVSVDDAGIVYSEQGEPEHVVSVTSVERHRWVDPKDGAEYVLELPQKEAMYLPVSIQ